MWHNKITETTFEKGLVQTMKKLVIGILAHVDAGKTTLSESLLYESGNIRQLGRVDHKNAFLDTFTIEKERGITIFSKQARLSWNNIEITLLDTPGHVDFSTEMERTLQVLDYAILVVSGADGVQGHTKTLWRLLCRYQIPTFIFVNKMDLDGVEKQNILAGMQKELSDSCIDFTPCANSADQAAFYENIAMCQEDLLDTFMENGNLSEEDICTGISNRTIFPCYFGSALKMQGIKEFMEGLSLYTKEPVYGMEFGAKVYKITRDEQNNRLTYLKVTGGSLKVKDSLTNAEQVENGIEHGEIWDEKVHQIRLYSGSKFESVNEVPAGSVCAVTGLSYTYPGESLGAEEKEQLSLLEPVLTYQILLEPDLDAAKVFRQLKELEEEDPMLHILWNDALQEIHIQLMGEVQIEILKEIIKERYHIWVEFGEGNIVYKETIKNTVEGVGHFEPLRHYAEVHLLLEPGEPRSGVQISGCCSEDVLDKNWQRLIYTHLEEREHPGVLTGFPVTDIKLTLIGGRAHQKHTEGGDFRQATYRAVRQGLKKAESVVLEPYYRFILEIPSENVGRAMNDIQNRNGSFENPEILGENTRIVGSAPVATMKDYVKEVNAYTHGKGRLFCELKGYGPCHNQEEVIEQIGYDSEADTNNPTCSVFCAHGAGFLVPWNEVENYMHVESCWQQEDTAKETENIQTAYPVRTSISKEQEEDALENIMIREFGSKRKRFDDYGNVYYGEQAEIEKNRRKKKTVKTDTSYQKTTKPHEPKKEYLLVDGYNIIFAWDELTEMAKISLDAARLQLMDWLCNYQGYRNIEVIVVFDAYKVKDNPGSVKKYHNIHVVFTKEAETADMYIEKATHDIGRKYKVTVATSDALEQMIILRQGALRMSANELKKDMKWIEEQMEHYLKE